MKPIRVIYTLTTALALLSTSISAADAASMPDVSACSDAFHQIPLPDTASQCQLFDDELPASMVFFSAQSMADVIAYYKQSLPTLQQQEPVNDRVLLTSENRDIRIVVSPDPNGTQVDILVSRAPTS